MTVVQMPQRAAVPAADDIAAPVAHGMAHWFGMSRRRFRAWLATFQRREGSGIFEQC